MQAETFFGMVILLTFVATLGICGIASRNLIGAPTTDGIAMSMPYVLMPYVLCGRYIHMELSTRVSEDWLYWDFYTPSENARFNVYLGSVVLIFHCFIDYCNARPVWLVVDLALNTVEHWTSCVSYITSAGRKSLT